MGLGWVLGGFWERLEKVWTGFVKVLEGLEGSWGEFGELLEGFSTMPPYPPERFWDLKLLQPMTGIILGMNLLIFLNTFQNSF